jgi:hypothetical protein
LQQLLYICRASRMSRRTAAALRIWLARPATKFEQAGAHAGLARSHQPAGEPARALDHWHEALTLYTELSTPEADQNRAQLSVGNDGRGEPFTASLQGSFDP